MTNIPTTQYYDDNRFNKFARGASRIASTIDPINKAIGSVGTLAGNAIGLASLGYKALTTPFDLIEHGQRLSASNSLSALNKLGTAFANNPQDFSEQQYYKMQGHLGNVSNFLSSYGSEDRGSIFRTGVTSPTELNRMRAVFAEHSRNLAEGFEPARQRMIDTYELMAKGEVFENNLRNFSPTDAVNLSDLGVPLSVPKDAKYLASHVLPVFYRFDNKDNEKMSEIQNNIDVYELNKNKNTPQAIDLCRKAITKASKLSKDLYFPQAQRAKLLNLKYDYAVRSRRWRT